MSAPQLEQWLSDWCNRAIGVLSNWDEWASTFQQATLGSPAKTIEMLVEIGEHLTRELHNIMDERREKLATVAASSVRQLIGPQSPNRRALLKQVGNIESLAVRVRQQCAAQWVVSKQSSQMIDELLFIFRSGHSHPATYSTDEQDAFQGGFVLDSTA